MSTPILWYFADPMCSWCWGFSPAIEAVRDAYRKRMKIALVLGGLRPGTTEPMTPTTREEILHHWHAVHERTGQPFHFVDFPHFRRHISTSSLRLLKRPRAQLVEVTVPADSIVKPLDVFKHI